MLQWKYLEKNSKEGYWDNQKKSVLPLMVGVLKMTKNDRKMVVFLRDSILDKVELRKGNRKMNNKNMGVIKWADLFFGLREKREWRRKNVVSVV